MDTKGINDEWEYDQYSMLPSTRSSSPMLDSIIQVCSMIQHMYKEVEKEVETEEILDKIVRDSIEKVDHLTSWNSKDDDRVGLLEETTAIHASPYLDEIDDDIQIAKMLNAKALEDALCFLYKDSKNTKSWRDYDVHESSGHPPYTH